MIFDKIINEKLEVLNEKEVNKFIDKNFPKLTMNGFYMHISLNENDYNEAKQLGLDPLVLGNKFIGHIYTVCTEDKNGHLHTFEFIRLNNINDIKNLIYKFRYIDKYL